MKSATLQKFSLSLHPDKTRLVDFGRFAAACLDKRLLSGYQIPRFKKTSQWPRLACAMALTAAWSPRQDRAKRCAHKDLRTDDGG
jgi:hypothetical protein